jgi:hypothetical protein
MNAHIGCSTTHRMAEVVLCDNGEGLALGRGLLVIHVQR